MPETLNGKSKECTSEVEFWEWYDKEIKEVSNIKNDMLTFGEVITQIEDEFFAGYRLFKKPPEKRDRKHPSDQKSWYNSYYIFYRHLPANKPINLKDIQKILSRWEIGTKSYKDAVSVMKKLARTEGGLRANLAFRLALFFGEFTLEDLDLDFPVHSPNSFLSGNIIS